MTSQGAADRLETIQAGALDPTSDLATVLRQCLALGADSGSERLRSWATRELKGYESGIELPSYRVTHALLYMDRLTEAGRFSHENVPATMLPDVARDLPDRDIEIRESLATLLQYLEDARKAGENAILIAPPSVDALVPLMNDRLAQRAGQGLRQRIERVYWAVPFATFTGIADTVRTILVELVAEIRAGLPVGATLPSRELADKAVNIVVFGNDNQVLVGQSGDGGTAVVGGKNARSSGTSDSRAKTIAWWTFGIIASAGAIAGVITLVHH